MHINSPFRLIILIIIGICLVLYFLLGKNRISHKKTLITLLISILDSVAIVCLLTSVLHITITEQYSSEYILIDASYSMNLNDYTPNRYERVKEGIKSSKGNSDTTIVPFGSFPLPLSFEDYARSTLQQFSQLTGRTGSAPGDALARVIEQKPQTIILITDGGINSGLDLSGIGEIYSGKLIVGLLQSNDSLIAQSGQKSQLVTMNQSYRESVITGKNELLIISNKNQIKHLLSRGIGFKQESISHIVRKVGGLILIISLLIRLLTLFKKKKVA